MWAGMTDALAKFENLFPLPKGVSYNAYLMLDTKNRPVGHGGSRRGGRVF